MLNYNCSKCVHMTKKGCDEHCPITDDNKCYDFKPIRGKDEAKIFTKNAQ